MSNALLRNEFKRLESLVILEEYPAEFIKNEYYCYKGQRIIAPIVRIFKTNEPHDKGDYLGYMVPCTSQDIHRRQISASLREDVIGRGADSGRFYVNILEIPGGSPEEPYVVTASRYYFRIEAADTLLSVLRGEDIFYAQYNFISRFGEPALNAYRKDGTHVFGYLCHSRTFNLINIIIKQLKVGKHIIARTVKDSSGPTLFFEPVINFLESDYAETPSLERLVTNVTGFKKGSLIFNLPIVQVENNKNQLAGDDDVLGVGYVLHPIPEDKELYFKPVYILGAASDKGKYIPAARIIADGVKIILAKKIDNPADDFNRISYKTKN